MLHFAYGSNMYRPLMRKHAPAATPIGVARLAGYRFVITADGYASIEPACAQTVHGLLWRLTPRDRATLDAWENIASGSYRAEFVPVRCNGRQWPTLVYVARPRPRGLPKPGYMEIVIKAARELKLPAAYITSLENWLPTQPGGAGHRKLGEFA